MTDVVTDPALIEQLNRNAQPPGQAPAQAPAQATQNDDSGPVTDPALIAALHANARPPMSTGEQALDAAASLGTGVLSGVLTAPGAIGDLANLVQLGYGKVTGDNGIQDQARAGLRGENGFDLGTASLEKFLSSYGLLPTYVPRSDLGSGIYNVADFAGNTAGLGVGKLASQAAISALMEKGLSREAATQAAAQIAKEAPATIGKDAAVGTGSGIGNEGGRSVADATFGKEDQNHPWQRFLMEMAPTVLGGGLTGSALNRTLLYDTPDIVKDFKAAGVSPRFATDVNPDPGVVGKLLSRVLPNRFGAQGISQDAAQQTQNELGDYAKRVLTNPATQQQQGAYIQRQAESSIESLKDETSQAWNDVSNLIAPDTPVSIDNTKSAIGDLVNQASNPAVKQIVQSPGFAKYEPLLKLDNLSWQDVNVLRQEVGSAMQGADGADLGLIKQVYRGIMDDLRSTASQDPKWLEAYNHASEVSSENSAKIKGVLEFVTNKDSPETLPDWLVQQAKKGSTRMDDLFSTPGFSDQTQAPGVWSWNAQMYDHMGMPLDSNTPVDKSMINAAAQDVPFNFGTGPGQSMQAPSGQAQVGQWMLRNKAQNGTFDLDRLMKFWQSASPEAQKSLTLDPQVANGMKRLSNLYQATEQSRELANRAPTSLLNDPATATTALGGLATAVGNLAGGGHALGPLGLAGAGLIAAPMVMGGVAKTAQIPGLVSRLATPLGGNMIDGKWGLPAAAGVSNTVPDIWQPPKNTDHPKEDVMGWLGKTDRQSATAYISQKLGQQAAQQIASLDGPSYGAALFQMALDPASRSALTG